MRIEHFIVERVEWMPRVKQSGVLYVSERFSLTIHLCACGCGEETVTPLRNGEWSLIESPLGFTLSPSIGNQQFACHSHYWIRNSAVVWELS
jgi:hypothetical protein